MRLLNPAMLFLASGLPLVMLFYMLKMKRKDTPVSSIYLWQDLLQDVQANRPWQRLKLNILMLLQLLILAVLIFSLASPVISKSAEDARNIVLVIDTSQSMSATDADGTRLEAAKQKANAVLSKLPDGAKISLIATADRARVIFVNSQDKRAVMRSVNALEPEGSTTSITNALRLGSSIASRVSDSRVYVISDGCFENITSSMSAPITFVQVGRGGDNVAIRAASLLESPSPPHAPQLFVSVKNYASSVKKVLVSVYSSNELVDARQLTLEGRSMSSITFKDGLNGVDTAEVRLRCEDDLAIDNTAWALGPKGTLDKIALVTEDGMFLKEGLQAVSSAKVVTIAPRDWPKGSKDADFVVFDGFIPKEFTGKNMLIVNPPNAKGSASTPLFYASGFKKITSLEALDPEHALLQHVDFSGVSVARLKTTAIPAWMRVVAGGTSAAAIAVGEDRGMRAILLSFDLVETDLPLRIAFPVLLANCIDYLTPAAAGASTTHISIGEAIAVRPEPRASSITIDYPDGQSTALAKTARVFMDTQAPGVYRIKRTNGDKVSSEQFAVSLIAAGESEIKPVQHHELRYKPSSNDKRDSTAENSIVKWIALAALFLLFVEGFVYVKGY